MNKFSIIRKIKEDITLLTGRIMRNLQALEDQENEGKPRKMVCQNIMQIEHEQQANQQIQYSQSEKEFKKKKKQNKQNKQISQQSQELQLEQDYATPKENKISNTFMQTHKTIIKHDPPLETDQQQLIDQLEEQVIQSQNIQDIMNDQLDPPYLSEEEEEDEINIDI